MARWISAAATLESTPPDRPRITSSSPTCSRIGHRLGDVVAHHPVGPRRRSEHEALEQRAALQRVRDLGWNCTA